MPLSASSWPDCSTGRTLHWCHRQISEFKFQILLRHEFLSLQIEPLQIFRFECLVSQTRLSFEKNVARMTHEKEFSSLGSKNTTTISAGVVERCVYEWYLILSEKSSNWRTVDK